MNLEKNFMLEHSELPAVKYRDPSRSRVAVPSLLEMSKFRVECCLEAQQARIDYLLNIK
jgi:hypothetical protein